MQFSELGQCTDLGSPGPAVPQKAPGSSVGALPSPLASGSCWPALCHCGLVVHFLGFPMNRPCCVCPPFAWLLPLAWLPGSWSRRCLQSSALPPPGVAASELVLHAPAGGPGGHHLQFGLVQCGCREDLRPSICVDVFFFLLGRGGDTRPASWATTTVHFTRSCRTATQGATAVHGATRSVWATRRLAPSPVLGTRDAIPTGVQWCLIMASLCIYFAFS